VAVQDSHRLLLEDGYNQEVADSTRRAMHADQEDIVDLTNRQGCQKAYILAGRDATQKRLTPISDLRTNLSDYDLVVVGTPIWAWGLSAPIRNIP